MYIHGVMTANRFCVGLTLLALLVAGGPALYCAQPGAAAMPCCKPSTHCDLGMKANACCVLDPTPASPERTADAQVPSTGFHSLQRLQPATAGGAAPAVSGPVALLRAERLGYPPAHDASTPLFLRNASILR